MRLALVLATFLGVALATSAEAADPPAPPPSVTDVRCMVVSGVLARSADPSFQDVGRSGLFYFSGRLDGRGDADNLAARVSDAYDKMTADDIKAQIPICVAKFTAAMQSLQQIANSFPSSARPAAAPSPAP